MEVYFFESYFRGKMDKLFFSGEDFPRIAMVASSHRSSLPMGNLPEIGHRGLGSFFLEGGDHDTCSIMFIHTVKTVLFSALIASKSFDLLPQAENDPLLVLFDIWERLTDDQRLQWLQAFARTDTRFVVDFRHRVP